MDRDAEPIPIIGREEFQNRVLKGLSIQIAVILLSSLLFKSAHRSGDMDLIFLSGGILILVQFVLGLTLLSPKLLLARIHDAYPRLVPTGWRALWLKSVRFCPPSYALLVLFLLLKDPEQGTPSWVFRKPARAAMLAIAPVLALYSAFVVSRGDVPIGRIGYWAAPPTAAFLFSQGEVLSPVLRTGGVEASKDPVGAAAKFAERARTGNSSIIGMIITQASLMKRLEVMQAPDGPTRVLASGPGPDAANQVLDTLEQVIAVTEILDHAPQRFIKANPLSYCSPATMIEGGLITLAEEAATFKYYAVFLPQLNELLTQLGISFPERAERIAGLRARLQASQSFRQQITSGDSRVGRFLSGLKMP